MWWIWPIYIICLVVVVFVSTKLAKYVDLLENRTKLSGALLGGILLAGITSLPELVTSATAALIGEPHMTQGNILGANLFDIAIIGALLLTYPRKLRNVSPGLVAILWVHLIPFLIFKDYFVSKFLIGIQYHFFALGRYLL